MHYPSRFPRRLAQISDRRVFSLALVAVVCAALIEPSRGQALSQRTITLVVGYAAGGTGDMVARVVARKLSEALGQSVTVDNRPGVSGGLATQSVARAKADGHTILVGQSAEIAINPHWLKGLSYKPDRDLQPIALGVTVPLGLVVSAKAPYATLNDLVTSARQSKSALSYASAGIGTPAHFAGELLKLRTSANIKHVPYRGAGPALNDIIDGRVDLYFSGLPAAMGHVREGRIKLLAVSSDGRSAIAADVPSVAEADGLAPFDVTLWVGFFAPRRTPREIVARLNSEINEVLAQPEVKQRLLNEGAIVLPMSVDQFTSFVKAEGAKYERIIKETGLKPE